MASSVGIVQMDETPGHIVNSQPSTFNPSTRNPKPETRNPIPETRNPKPETRNLKPETRNAFQHGGGETGVAFGFGAWGPCIDTQKTITQRRFIQSQY